MNLSDLARDIPGARLVGTDVAIGAVEDDSRKVVRGGLFVAVRGLRSDGHAFLGDVVVQREPRHVAGDHVRPRAVGV